MRNSTFPQPGDQVIITQNPRAPREESHLIGRIGTFDGLTRTYGYAIVRLQPNDATYLLIHPENLSPAPIAGGSDDDGTRGPTADDLREYREHMARVDRAEVIYGYE